MNDLSQWSYQAPGSSARAAQAGLIAYGIAVGFNVAACVYALVILSGIGAEWPSWWSPIERLLVGRPMLSTVAFWATGIAWMRWKWIVTANAHAFEPGIERSPTWAAWSYVVPIAFLFVPYLAMRDVVRALRSQDQTRSRVLSNAWWVLVLWTQVGGRVLAPYVDGFARHETALVADILFYVASLGLTAVAFSLVAAVSRGQADRYAEETQGGGAGTAGAPPSASRRGLGASP